MARSPARITSYNVCYTKLLRHGARRAATKHDRIDPAVHLLEDLRASGLVMRAWIVGITELVDEVGAGSLAGNPFGHVLVVLGMTLGSYNFV